MFKLKEEQREELKKPLGRVVREVKKDEIRGKIVSIGDFVTAWLLEHGIMPNIAIIDHKIERRRHGKEIKINAVTLKVRNPAGEITEELWDAIEKAYRMNEPVLIDVEGEEDLAALPAILMAPAGANVIYGLPSHGMVIVEVGEYEKEKVKNFINRMERD